MVKERRGETTSARKKGREHRKGGKKIADDKWVRERWFFFATGMVCFHT